MLHVARQHIGDRLDAAMRVPREARQVLVGVVVAEIVEQQERVVVGGVAEPERTLQLDAGALHGRLRVRDLADGTDGHRGDSSASGFRLPAFYGTAISILLLTVRRWAERAGATWTAGQMRSGLRSWT